MKYKTILLILAITIIASTILSFIPIQEACGQETSGCYIVQASDYETTFGISNAHLGLIAFFGLFIITLLHVKKPTKTKKKLITLGLIGGSVVAIYFLYLQFFVIKAICPYCMVVDFGTLLALGLQLFVKD